LFLDYRLRGRLCPQENQGDPMASIIEQPCRENILQLD
jgi:hypothetical protein